MYLSIRIQISKTEYYYAIIGPTLTLSYNDTLIKTILKKAKFPMSQKEEIFDLYKSIPSFQTKTKNLFLTCYNLLTTIKFKELPTLLTDSQEVKLETTYHTFHTFQNPAYTNADIEWNCQKEQLWRFAISRGDLKKAKQALNEMTSTDYLYCTPNDSLQTRKHILFSVNTLCRVAAIDGGADFISAHQTHNTFFLSIKNLSNTTELDMLIQHILETYCNLVIASLTKTFSPIVKKAITYIHYNYEQPLTLHMVAQSIPCGESHLSRCFHKETKKTFKEYLNEFRIQQAISLLKTGLYRITDIALLVGFSSYTKFSIAFKKQTGIRASEYSKMN